MPSSWALQGCLSLLPACTGANWAVGQLSGCVGNIACLPALRPSLVGLGSALLVLDARGWPLASSMPLTLTPLQLAPNFLSVGLKMARWGRLLAMALA